MCKTMLNIIFKFIFMSWSKSFTTTPCYPGSILRNISSAAPVKGCRSNIFPLPVSWSGQGWPLPWWRSCRSPSQLFLLLRAVVPRLSAKILPSCADWATFWPPPRVPCIPFRRLSRWVLVGLMRLWVLLAPTWLLLIACVRLLLCVRKMRGTLRGVGFLSLCVARFLDSCTFTSCTIIAVGSHWFVFK